MVGGQGKNVFSVYLFRGRNVHHRKTLSSQFQAGLEAVLSVVCECTHQLRNNGKELGLCSQPVACVGWWVSFFNLIRGVDSATWFREKVLPPPLLYLPGMQFELCLLLDSSDLSKLPGSWPKKWRSLKQFFSLLSKNVFTFLELWLTDSFSWCCKNFPYALEFISFISKRPMVPSKPQWSEPHRNTILLGWICAEDGSGPSSCDVARPSEVNRRQCEVEGRVGEAKSGGLGSGSGLALFQDMALSQSHEVTLWASVSPAVLNKKCFKSVQKPFSNKIDENSWETTEKGRSAHKEWVEALGQRGKDAESHMARLLPELLRSSKYVKNFLLDTGPTQETKILVRGAMHLAKSVPQINIPL